MLLLFIRASPDQLWELHLQSLHALCPYFFALDMINYARMTPVYLTQMYALKEKDPQTWEFYLQEDFQVINRKFYFLHWIRSRNWVRKSCTKAYRGNKGHCTFPAGSRWILFNRCWDGKYSGEFLWKVWYWGKSVIRKGWILSVIQFQKPEDP